MGKEDLWVVKFSFDNLRGIPVKNLERHLEIQSLPLIVLLFILQDLHQKPSLEIFKMTSY